MRICGIKLLSLALFVGLAFFCTDLKASGPVDEFAYTEPAAAMSRLDSFLGYLTDNPTYGGNVIVYGAR